MRILVTGGAGFIGSHLVERLVALEHDVVVVDDCSTGSDNNVASGAKLIKLNIADAHLAAQLGPGPFNVLLHLAAKISVPESLKDPLAYANTNILGSINVIEAARTLGVKKIIFASTCAVYGEAEALPVDERTLAGTLAPYGFSKRVIEEYLEYLARTTDITTINLRFSNAYGPRQRHNVISLFCRALAQGKPLVINGTGEQTRDFVYVDDVVDAYVAALSGQRSGIYNVATETEVSIRELAQSLIAVSGRTVPIEHRPDPFEIKNSALSSQKIRHTFGWQPQTTLAQGLAKTWEWYRTEVAPTLDLSGAPSVE